jgi:tripartite-type tricarboxylate transporter receptor subunit TctC
MGKKFWSLALAFFAIVAASRGRADSVEDFYKGKDIRVLIGADVGGTYGLYAQLAARHMRQYIPGQPNLIVQYMPGAGGNVGLNYSHGVAPKDGSLMHLVHAEVLFETLLTNGVKFNARDYNWIGRFADADGLSLVTKKSGAKTLDDAKRREVTTGVTGVNNVFALAPLLLMSRPCTRTN